MEQQQLSSKAQLALAALKALPQTELAQVVAIASTELATRIACAAQTSTPEQLAEASSKLVEGVQAALTRGFALASARAGFKQITAPDGTTAIEVRITRRNGEEVTCLLSEGAKGKLYRELEGYGKENLNGASLLPRADFEAVVDSLLEAIKGLKEVDGVLQTEDAALKKAYQIVTEGVRIGGVWLSWANFDLDKEGAVVGRRVDENGTYWLGADVYRIRCALFVASPAELKK